MFNFGGKPNRELGCGNYFEILLLKKIAEINPIKIPNNIKNSIPKSESRIFGKKYLVTFTSKYVIIALANPYQMCFITTLNNRIQLS